MAKVNITVEYHNTSIDITEELDEISEYTFADVPVSSVTKSQVRELVNKAVARAGAAINGVDD